VHVRACAQRDRASNEVVLPETTWPDDDSLSGSGFRFNLISPGHGPRPHQVPISSCRRATRSGLGVGERRSTIPVVSVEVSLIYYQYKEYMTNSPRCCAPRGVAVGAAVMDRVATAGRAAPIRDTRYAPRIRTAPASAWHGVERPDAVGAACLARPPART